MKGISAKKGLLVLSFFLASCSSSSYYQDRYIASYRQGAFDQAEDLSQKAVSNEMPGNDFKRSNDSALLLLDLATLNFANGKSDEAIKKYQLALQALDFYNQRLARETVGQIFLEDSVQAYSGTDFEQVLARVYFALALMHQGDNSNAYALLRQAEEFQQMKRELYRQDRLTKDFKLPDNALAKYLLAVSSEKKGDSSNAGILYSQVQNLLDIDPFPLELAPPRNERSSATLLLICHNGNAPEKITEMSPASAASALALEILLATQHVDPAISSLTGIPIPALIQRPESMPAQIYAKVDGMQKPFFPLYNVSQAAADELHQQIPLIAARGVARMVSRRAAVAYAGAQDPALGTLVDMAALIANANTKADTRTWATLPSQIDVARYDLAPGIHEVEMSFWPSSPMQKAGFCSIRLMPGELCVINAFYIHPNVISIQIPKKNLNTLQGETL